VADTDGAAEIRRLEALKSLRGVHERVWRDCFDFTYPLRGSGFNGQIMSAQEGQNRQAQNIVDVTAVDSVRILVSAIMGGMTPANSLWFGMHVPGADDDGEAWLSESSQGLFDNIHGSNFDAAAFESNLDGVIAGWFVLYIDEDVKQGGFVFEQWSLASCYVTSSTPGGRIDTIYREYRYTTEQAVKAFGIDQVSESIRKANEDKRFDDRFDFVQAIYPRKDAKEGSTKSRELPFASCHIEVASSKVVRESGYNEFPCVVPRWLMIPDSVYAVGPVNDALPAIKRLNDLARMELAAADLSIAGMWIAVDDGVLTPSAVKVGPRKIISANDVDSMKELKSGADFNVAWTMQEKLQQQIRKILMADQLQPQDGPAMTATEVHVRVNLIRQLLGPIYARLQAEYLEPLIERTFGIAYRASQRMWAAGIQGVFNPPPESVAGRNFTIRYVSPLARSQKLEEVSAMDQLEDRLLARAEIQPQEMDVYDWEQADRERGKMLGVPGKLMRKPADIDALRQARAEQQQQQQQAAAMQPVVDGAGKAVGQRLVNA
jgi:hypothetical protein